MPEAIAETREELLVHLNSKMRNAELPSNVTFSEI